MQILRNQPLWRCHPAMWGQPLQGLKQRSGMVQQGPLCQALCPSRLPGLSHFTSSQHLICKCCLSLSTLSVLQRWKQAWALPELPPEGAAGAGEHGMSGAGSVQVKIAPPPPPRAGTPVGSGDVSLRRGQGRGCPGDDPCPMP